MVSRVVLAGLVLSGGLMAAGAANAQYYGRPHYGGGGQWDCNPSRCIDRSSGALWESTCNHRGCFPLRPARQRSYGGPGRQYYGGGPVYHGVPNGRGGYVMVPDERY